MPLYHQKFVTKHHIEYEIVSTDDYSFLPADFYSLVAIFSDPAVYKYVSEETLKKHYPDSPYTELQAIDFLRFSIFHWQKKEQFRFLIRRTDNAKLVGYINIEPRDGDIPERSMVKLSAEPGFMKAALKIVLGFASQMGYSTTFGLVDVTNERMNNFALSFGMKLVGQVTENGHDFNRYEFSYKI
ncbi:GNAT family N-acetyltransferase [Candidatus Shapirobacteria bacterium]|nr:GNAT family N-acetyltransferase [Candidatus Shapirobacteria bacterium]